MDNNIKKYVFISLLNLFNFINEIYWNYMFKIFKNILKKWFMNYLLEKERKIKKYP